MALDLSVVVPTFERRASLERLIDALGRQDLPPDRFEVIVVDDGSTDDTKAWLRAAATPFELRLAEQAHGGPGAARNRGVALARAELIVFLDDDVVPDASLLSAHLAAHARLPGSVVIGPMLPPDGWRRPAWIRWEEQKLLRQYRDMRRGRWACTYRQFFTGNASLARARFVAAGGFDQTLTRAEDVDLGYRLYGIGMRFAFEPGARAYHYPTRSFEAWRQMPYRYGQADVVMQRDKGNPALAIAFDEFRGRRWLARFIARACVGHPPLVRSAVFALSAATRFFAAARQHRLAGAALSGIFSVLYWQGVSDALGNPAVARDAAAGRRPALRAVDP